MAAVFFFCCLWLSLRGMRKTKEENFAMKYLQARFHIIDCHENFSNFLAMTQNSKIISNPKL
ncbi:hypothetical protein [Helicobacter sp.]|uniref:hypothetical protein n=1 Tax=Helicobacter sp. TaxID=218 RepID=UPI002A912FA2|nr:hypothetical protein [Helicobacter sp.]MDY5557291.1 hypothetical protein [Helicobacter sp.]